MESRLSALTGDGTTTIPEYTILYTIVYTILYTILYTIPYTILSVMKETSSHPYSHSLPFTPIHSPSHSFPTHSQSEPYPYRPASSPLISSTCALQSPVTGRITHHITSRTSRGILEYQKSIYLSLYIPLFSLPQPPPPSPTRHFHPPDHFAIASSFCPGS